MTFSIELIAIALAAMLIDAAIGGTHILGRFPGPDRLFHIINESLAYRLDLGHRSNKMRMLRGGIVTLLALIITIPLGNWLTGYFLADKIGAGIAMLFLLLIMGQRAAIDTASELITILADVESREDNSRFDAARWGVERLVLRISDGMIANMVVLFFSGLGGLLFYRFLTMTLAVGAPSGILKPASPYYRIPFLLYEIITFIPASLAMLLMSTAAFFIPGAQLHLLASIEEDVPGAILGRKFPLLAMAHALQYCFREDSNEVGVKTIWVGPEGGRSKLEAEDLRNALYLIIATWVFVVIIMGLMALPMLNKL